MDGTHSINGTLFAEMAECGAVNLRNNVQIVNELNVFPIPDGDTGENMARTIEGGIASAAANPSADISAVAGRLADGMLMSARGNSGVILSQFFEGIRLGLTGKSVADVSTLKAAFRAGVKQAYAAVVQPTEGTILTVMREAYEAANAVDDGASAEEYFAVYIDEMYASLNRTPELLPVLKDAGVIDSGGAGLVYIVEGMLRALRGESAGDAMHTQSRMAESTETAATSNDSKFNETSPMPFGYCTELIVQLRSEKTDVEAFSIETLVNYLNEMGGESVVAFKTGTRVKLHVHTFQPDKVLEYCRSIGEFVTVKIENMSIQHTETVIRNRFERQTPKKKHKKFAAVAVADGAGIIEQLRSVGADYVVDGKQTGNPSTSDFIEAFEAVDADNIFVFPNNSNIIMAANQAAELYTSANIIVIPTKTVAEGYAALSMHDWSSNDIKAITYDLTEAIKGVATGLVTYSVRDCTAGGMHIKKGDWLGFSGDGLLSCADTVTEAACKLLDAMDLSEKSVVIAARGKALTDGKVIEHITEFMKNRYPDIEFYDFDGGQDVYSLVFIVE